MIRIGVLGAAGYTARELLQRLAHHPEVEVTTLTTRQAEPRPIAEVHPSLNGQFDLDIINISLEELAARSDCVFCCLPHAASAEAVSQLLQLGKRVIDFSADYRLDDPQTYQSWYHHEHPDPERLGKVAYGLPELFRESIRSADLVANPGCFPTSAILALAPLVEHRVIELEGIVVDAKTGISGAGRQPKPHLHFPEANESVAAYAVGTHRHMPEIDQILCRALGVSVSVVFTPHLIPMDRGILSTVYARPLRSVSVDALKKMYSEFYAHEPFVRLVASPPSTKQTSHTNFCDIHVDRVRGTIIVLSALDNLVKGASGAAVQNLNLMYGWDETTAL